MIQPPLHRPGSAAEILEWFDSDPSQILSNCCLFLDVDGTLIEFKADPTKALADPELITLLQSAQAKFAGALALVSGRLLATLDGMLSPLRLPASGLYGLERRDLSGLVHRKTASGHALDSARKSIVEFAADHRGLIAEDKGTAIALHYRGAPALGAECRRVVYAAARGIWPQFQVIEGSMVVEIVPAGTSKATAIEEFMREPPFAARIPIALGDDYSDCDAFTAVHRHGGLALAVGRRIYGDHCLDDCQAARRWLSRLLGLNAQ
jgi:trehalose 6-phosphate phosphatase